MKDMNLFLASSDGETKLESIAAELFRVLGVEMWEERDSSQYPPDEHYYAGYTQNAMLIVADDDVNQKPGYPFFLWIHDPTFRKGPGHTPEDPHVIAKTLSEHSFRVFVPTGQTHLASWDGAGTEYGV